MDEKERSVLMTIQNDKCVMLIRSDLPLGIIANTAGILGITLGKECPQIAGMDVVDKAGQLHLGITEIPVPILKADEVMLKELRLKLYKKEYEELTVVDFSDVAQSCITYDDYIHKSANTEGTAFSYFGIGLYGDRKLINKLTGNIPLLR